MNTNNMDREDVEIMCNEIVGIHHIHVNEKEPQKRRQNIVDGIAAFTRLNENEIVSKGETMKYICDLITKKDKH